jgi:hypothetical protein
MPGRSQVGELLQVVAIAHPVVAQGVAEVPELLDQGGGVHGSPVKYPSSKNIGHKRSNLLIDIGFIFYMCKNTDSMQCSDQANAITPTEARTGAI